MPIYSGFGATFLCASFRTPAGSRNACARQRRTDGGSGRDESRFTPRPHVPSSRGCPHIWAAPGGGRASIALSGHTPSRVPGDPDRWRAPPPSRRRWAQPDSGPDRTDSSLWPGSPGSVGSHGGDGRGAGWVGRPGAATAHWLCREPRLRLRFRLVWPAALQ